MGRLNPKHKENQLVRQFPERARRPGQLHVIRSAHVRGGRTYRQARAIEADDQGATVITLSGGITTTRAALNVLSRHAETHARAKAEGKPTHEPPPAVERKAA